MGRSLLKDLDRSELLYMRESGMTNQDIANAIGVSLSTIYRCIGAQPPETRKHYESRGPLPEARTTKDCTTDDEAALVIDGRSISLAGLFAGYKVDIKAREITIFVEDGVDALVVPFDQVSTFAKELVALSKHVDGLSIGNEMW